MFWGYIGGVVSNILAGLRSKQRMDLGRFAVGYRVSDDGVAIRA